MLDNECSNELKSAFFKHDIGFQLDKPHLHRADAAERAIRTFKEHFKAGLASLDPDFPVREWDRLIPQGEMTLNLLRASRINPKLSAFAHLFGMFDYNKTPIVPPGTKIVAHLKPDTRSSWAANGEEGWTIGPALDHYRCLNCYFPQSKSQRNVDTVTFFPKTIKFPKIAIDDFLKQAAMDIIAILADPPSTTTLSLKVGDETRNALLELARTFNRVEKLPLCKIPSAPRVNETSTPPKVQETENEVVRKNVTINANDAKNIKYSAFDQNEIKKRKYMKKNTEHRYNLRKRKSHTNSPLLQCILENEVTNFKGLAAGVLTLQTYAPQSMYHIYDANGKKQSIGKLIKGPDAQTKWLPALSNEWGRLAKGNDKGVAHTDTIRFISFDKVPTNRKVTYASFVCDYRPLKDEKWRIRLVVGGDKLEYELDSGSPATDLTETKLLINSVISNAKEGARFLSMDLKDMFLHTPMAKPEYMKIPFKYFPDDIIKRYNLHALVHSDNHVYIKIVKGMYGLKQAAILTYKNLSTILLQAGYKPK